MPRPVTPFHAAVAAEFKDWVLALPTTAGRSVYPMVESPGGLPPGWRVRASAHEQGRAGPQSAHVADRHGGGWILLRRVGSGDTVLNEYEETFAALYNTVCRFARGPIQAVPVWQPAETLMRNFLVSYYDPDDETEAAEQVLVALGARPRALPAALTHP